MQQGWFIAKEALTTPTEAKTPSWMDTDAKAAFSEGMAEASLRDGGIFVRCWRGGVKEEYS